MSKIRLTIESEFAKSLGKAARKSLLKFYKQNKLKFRGINKITIISTSARKENER